MTNKKENYFKELTEVKGLADTVKVKNKFNYLPWAVAVKALRLVHPDATIEILRFDGMPFLKTELGYFVEVRVSVFSGDGERIGIVHHTCLMPVLNHINKPIEKPNSFDINRSIQRATCKAIAQHGLGINLFTDEPLDDLEEDKPDAIEVYNKHIEKNQPANVSEADLDQADKNKALDKARACKTLKALGTIRKTYGEYEQDQDYYQQIKIIYKALKAKQPDTMPDF